MVIVVVVAMATPTISHTHQAMLHCGGVGVDGGVGNVVGLGAAEIYSSEPMSWDLGRYSVTSPQANATLTLASTSSPITL